MLIVDYRAYPLLFVEFQCVMLTWIMIQITLSSSCHPSLARAHSWLIFAAMGNYNLESHWQCCIWGVRNVRSLLHNTKNSGRKQWQCSAKCEVAMRLLLADWNNGGKFFDALCGCFFSWYLAALVEALSSACSVATANCFLQRCVAIYIPLFIFCVQAYIHLHA